MENSNSSSTNLNKLDGNVPFFKALPFGIQHVLAIFISNIAPILIIFSNPNINTDLNLTKSLVQNSLFIAGIGTLIQLFPIWKVGSKLPIYVGISFTYLQVATFIGINYGYDVIISSMLVGSTFMIFLGIFVKNIKRIIPEVVSSFVVLVLGLSLAFSQISEMKIFNKDFYTWQNIIVASSIIIMYFISSYLFNKKLKNYAILLALLVGYITALAIGMVDFEVFKNVGIITYPKIVNVFNLKFNIEAILSVCIIFLISVTEVFAAYFALDENNKSEEMIQGALYGIGATSFISALFGCTPVTPFMGNISIVNSTKVVNRKALSIGAIILVIVSFFPIFGALAMSIPQLVIYVTMTLLFLSIAVSGAKLLFSKKLTKHNILVISISAIISITLYILGHIVSMPEIFEMLCTNLLATSFVFSIILYYIIPKGEKINEKK